MVGMKVYSQIMSIKNERCIVVVVVGDDGGKMRKAEFELGATFNRIISALFPEPNLQMTFVELFPLLPSQHE